jgi:hypothetical protein
MPTEKELEEQRAADKAFEKALAEADEAAETMEWRRDIILKAARESPPVFDVKEWKADWKRVPLWRRIMYAAFGWPDCDPKDWRPK